jgi:hypothetical protein
MCDNVHIHPSEHLVIICATQGELLTRMPKGLWFWRIASPDDIPPDAEETAIIPPVLLMPDACAIDEYGSERCLCPVDLARTARENGYICSKKDQSGEWDPFDTHLYPSEACRAAWRGTEPTQFLRTCQICGGEVTHDLYCPSVCPRCADLGSPDCEPIPDPQKIARNIS